ncbi:MAG: Cell division protein FtsL [Acidobacteriota bacterium]|nr:Cell division protein FtsL [Acidobacteriota bacterium]
MKRAPIGQYGNPRVRRERDRAALRRQVVLLACGMLTACGFVLAAGQRFAAVRYGYESEQLREESARLISERERLTLELNEATAPGALEQAARGIGMQPARASQIGDAHRGGDAQHYDDAQVSSRRSAPRQSVIKAGARTGLSRKLAIDGPHAHAVGRER